jgi:hypothetical protein
MITELNKRPEPLMGWKSHWKMHRRQKNNKMNIKKQNLIFCMDEIGLAYAAAVVSCFLIPLKQGNKQIDAAVAL